MKLKYRVIERLRGKYSVEAMYELFEEVSRSEDYSWRKQQGKEAKGQWLVDLIVECQEHSKQTYGIRRVQSWLQRRKKKHVNLKAILRVRRKLNLLSVLRRRRAYPRYQQTVYKHPNLLNHGFDQVQPNQFWVTDLIYIPITSSILYICAVLNLCGKIILAWKIGSDMSSSLVTDIIREALKQDEGTGGFALHSNLWAQYTSQALFDLTREYHVSPIHAQPMENFFDSLKTECLYRAHFTSRADVEQLVSEYIDFYNFERISLKNGLTPIEFRFKAA